MSSTTCASSRRTSVLGPSIWCHRRTSAAPVSSSSSRDFLGICITVPVPAGSVGLYGPGGYGSAGSVLVGGERRHAPPTDDGVGLQDLPGCADDPGLGAGADRPEEVPGLPSPLRRL